ncbi:uncharacterized protein LOC142627948 [Castanea sativa]|uniref:uncharacterized protein LOC142627948 n=1 Tax=Castanea sativa TaxID=21020 RepID=UPI003F64B968
MKAYLARPPILCRPEEEEVLYAYVAVARHAVSLALVRMDRGIQKPVYYVSKSLQEADVRYLYLEKAILAIIHATKKLPSLLSAVKGQVLANLVAEFAEELGSLEVGERLERPVHVETVVAQCSWKLLVGGAVNKKGSGIGIRMVLPDGITLEKSLRLRFLATNNEVECEALLVDLNVVQTLGGKAIRAYCDSRLVVGQVLGEYEAKDPRMLWYLGRVKRLSRDFHSFTLEQVPRGKNSHADSLTTLATVSREDLPRIVLVESYMTPAYNKLPPVEVNSMRVGLSWQDPLVAFLKEGIVPKDWVEVEKSHRKVPRFWLSKDQKLYKCSYSRPYLLCVHPKAVEMLLEELHEGICSSHTGGWSLAHRALTQGYWWPSMQKCS